VFLLYFHILQVAQDLETQAEYVHQQAAEQFGVSASKIRLFRQSLLRGRLGDYDPYGPLVAVSFGEALPPATPSSMEPTASEAAAVVLNDESASAADAISHASDSDSSS
jgi:hypothetical protein